MEESTADYWTETFGCARHELEKALKKIGVIAMTRP
jgi:hypothetical protein